MNKFTELSSVLVTSFASLNMSYPKVYIISNQKSCDQKNIRQKYFAILLGSINKNTEFTGTIYDEVTTKTDDQPISLKTWLDIQNFNQNYLKMEFVSKINCDAGSIPEHSEIFDFCQTLTNRKYSSGIFARFVFEKISGEKLQNKFFDDNSDNRNYEILNPHELSGLKTVSTVQNYLQDKIPQTQVVKKIIDEVLSGSVGSVLGYFGATKTAQICYSGLGVSGGIAGGVVGALTVGVWSYLESYVYFDGITRNIMKRSLESPTDFSLDDAYNYFGIYPNCSNAEINDVANSMLNVFMLRGQLEEIEKVAWNYAIISEVRYRDVEQDKIAKVKVGRNEKFEVKNKVEKLTITQIGMHGVSKVVNIASQVFIKLG